MTPRTLRRILFPLAVLLVAAFAWWWDRKEESPPVRHDRDPVVPMPGPNEPPMKIMPTPPRTPPAMSDGTSAPR